MNRESVSFEDIRETDFLREIAWVILSSGMRETIIRKKFTDISAAFFNWQSSQKIYKNSDNCREEALKYFNNIKKINAIIKIAKHVYMIGFQAVKDSVKKEGIDYIKQLPFMGPATSYHLAKNIGLPVVKPDRHLTRIAKVTGYSSPQLLCSDIAKYIGEKIAVVDLVIWRYSTLYNDYLDFFSTKSIDIFTTKI